MNSIDFFFNDTAPTEIYTLSLHDALPICGIARILGIKRIVIHPLSSLLSAYGIANSKQFRYGLRSMVLKFDSQSHVEALSGIQSLESPLIEEIQKLGVSTDNITKKHFMD